MKIRKNAEQKNFIVNKDMYTLKELCELCKLGYIVCHPYDSFEEKRIDSILDIFGGDIFRIYASACTNVKVIYNSKYGFYENVVETKDGTQISVVI